MVHAVDPMRDEKEENERIEPSRPGTSIKATSPFRYREAHTTGHKHTFAGTHIVSPVELWLGAWLPRPRLTVGSIDVERSERCAPVWYFVMSIAATE